MSRTVPYSDRSEAFPLRVYRPSDEAKLPIVVYYHGGGFTFGDLDTNDRLCRKLSNRSGAIVVSVAYRLAPEHVFPAAVEDAYAALEWVAQKRGEIPGDPAASPLPETARAVTSPPSWPLNPVTGMAPK